MINQNSATISVYAGVGGEDAKDWVEMLLRMYQRYAQRSNWKFRLIYDNTLEIIGENVYGLLKNESGVHRLVRISPFDAKKLRHTSFALVEVLPELPELESKNLNIPEEDLRIELYRSSGPGGQNVNKRETAVRLIHLPTGLAAASQAERSQAQNREKALKLIKAKLFKLMAERQEKELGNLRTKVTPDWGHQIRSYVLHPYQMVKDHRTALKVNNANEVLEGNLDKFIKKG
ncbi:MAG: peptide chain release factor-like protein [Candidatus Paceibacterota bacterium]